jgi:hypothetical protein
MLVNSITIISGLFYGDLVAILVWHRWHYCFSRFEDKGDNGALEKHAPFLISLHYMAHKFNLAMQSLPSFPLVVKTKGLL